MQDPALTLELQVSAVYRGSECLCMLEWKATCGVLLSDE